MGANASVTADPDTVQLEKKFGTKRFAYCQTMEARFLTNTGGVGQCA
ncbi:hypothetical protein JOE11_000059 [Robbsia andropogonis]